MCLIINLPKENKQANITEVDLKMAIDRNYHGMGVMYPIEREDGWGMYVGYCDGTAQEQLEFFEEHAKQAKKGFACHVRLTTKGDNSLHNFHPHRITDDIWVMHNGTISGYGNEHESDTSEYVRTVLKPIISANPQIVYTKAFREMVERDVGSINKLLIMDKHGNVSYINKDRGFRRNGAWLSNEYSVSGCKTWAGLAYRVNEHGEAEEWDSTLGRWVEDDYTGYGYGYNPTVKTKESSSSAKSWGIKIPNMSKQELAEAIQNNPDVLALAIYDYTPYANWASQADIIDDCWTDPYNVATNVHTMYEDTI